MKMMPVSTYFLPNIQSLILDGKGWRAEKEERDRLKPFVHRRIIDPEDNQDQGVDLNIHKVYGELEIPPNKWYGERSRDIAWWDVEDEGV